MNEDDKKPEIGDRTVAVVQTPLFSGLKLWIKAKRESLDLWGFEKILGCDNTKYKHAVAGFKNLVNEIEHEYQSSTLGVGLGPDELLIAKEQRDNHLLDAKRDFIYSLPENYRMWFKKTKIFNSWRTEPSSWGFHESRYWGNRSGLTLKERRVLYIASLIGLVGLAVILIVSVLQDKEEASRDTTWETQDKPVRNIDSLVQAKLNKERKIELRNLAIERNNRIINEINSGYYTTTTVSMRSEIKMLMQLYHDIVYKENISKDAITSESISSSAGLIASNNPNAITHWDEFGQPLNWKMNARIQLAWEDVNWGLRVYYARKNRENKK
jgi:hypothetical protein